MRAGSIRLFTDLSVNSFTNVAHTLRDALLKHTEKFIGIDDYNQRIEAYDADNLVVVGLINKILLRNMVKLPNGPNKVFYGTTEGLIPLDDFAKIVAEDFKIVAVSDFVREMAEQSGLKVSGVVHHCIDMNDKEYDANFMGKVLRLVGNRKVVLTIGMNHLRKGFDNLLRAWSIVEGENPDAYLILHTYLGGHYDLPKMIDVLGLRRVWVTDMFGQLNTRQTNALYKVASLYVQPSYAEGFGLPVIEAYRFNLPVVGVGGTSLDEIIGANTGILIEPEGIRYHEDALTHFKICGYDYRELAQSIAILLEDNELRRDKAEEIEEAKWNWHLDNYDRFTDYLR